MGTFNQSIVGIEPSVLAGIYRDDTNIAVWQRDLEDQLATATEYVFDHLSNLATSVAVTPENAYETMQKEFGHNDATRPLSRDISELVDMFCCLFDLDQVGLRITALDHAMCPRFHVDRIPCRLVTTFAGIATEWLGDAHLDRSKLGHGANGLPDNESGLYESAEQIQQLTSGDVGLLKGSAWMGNENNGLVHRSPAITTNQKRLLMTLDFIDN